MSDKPEGPGWWIASDGKWYPPELHPEASEGSRGEVEDPQVAAAPDRSSEVPAVPAPAGGTAPQGAGEPHRWQGQSQKEAPVGRQFPDLFQKALQGSHLADNITVKYDGDDERNSLSPASGGSGRSAPMTTMTTMTTGGGVPVAAGTAGLTFAAPAKRKWRKGR